MTTHASTSVLESPNRFAEHFRAAIETAASTDLDSLARKLWAAHGAGGLSRRPGTAACRADPAAARASASSDVVRHGRGAAVLHPAIAGAAIAGQAGFASCAGASTAATGPLPPHLAAGFTTGELAVLKVISDEWLAHGACDRSLNELAARAGVCHSLAKRAVRLAELDGLFTVQRRPRSGRKHLTNIIRIIRAEWLDWLPRAGARPMRSTPATGPSRSLQKLEGYKITRHGHRFFRNSSSDRVDKTVKKENRTGASRA